jgi:hypothetical protein
MLWRESLIPGSFFGRRIDVNRNRACWLLEWLFGVAPCFAGAAEAQTEQEAG